jgi:hypothetical protein
MKVVEERVCIDSRPPGFGSLHQIGKLLVDSKFLTQGSTGQVLGYVQVGLLSRAPCKAT